jgi:predicted RNA-binding Zn-ribbon protein involved in translation (DUF1610 family)
MMNDIYNCVRCGGRFELTISAEEFGKALSSGRTKELLTCTNCSWAVCVDHGVAAFACPKCGSGVRQELCIRP